MDRALDAQLLSDAIGGRARLPTSEELARLLAEAELKLLAGQHEIDDQLVATGWYLHGLAASRWATEQYGAVHRRSAFRVAGHILDLVLQIRDLEPIERLRYCFAAQVAYSRSGLDPNAIAVYRREVAKERVELLLDLERDAHTIALLCGAAVIGMDLGRLLRDVRAFIEQCRRRAVAWDVESITNTIFGAAALVAHGAYDLAVFLNYGTAAKLQAARDAFQRAVNSDAAAGDRTARWVASHLLEIADHLGEASIWTVLPPDVPHEVRRAFSSTQPRVVSLWPPQAGFFPKVGDDLRTPLDASVKRLFLATPTSGGKTLLGQLLVTAHVARRETAVCYVAPTRSLCHEVRADIDRRLRSLRTSVADDLPPWVPAIPAPAQAAVEVMTPERLSYLLRADSEGLLRRFGLFVFDEVHNVGEAGRGWTLESALSYLHHATLGDAHRIVLISAVAGNQAHFVEWLGGTTSREVLHKHSDWKAPRRLHAIWTTAVDWEAAAAVPSSGGRAQPRTRYPVSGRLHVRKSGTGGVQLLTFREPVGEMVLRTSRSGSRKRDSTASTPAYRCLVPLIHHLASAGPTLVVESTRVAAARLARAVADTPTNVPLHPAPQSLIDLVVARLGDEHPLVGSLRGGAAFHHGSLPSEVRAAIEEAVSNGDLTCLVATTTMTEGVNLPVRSVVIASQGAHGADGYREYITGSKLINAIGRAGRAGKETAGVIVLVRPEDFSVDDFDRLDPERVDTNVRSTLATDVALAELAEFERLLAEGQDAVFQGIGNALDGFLAFVWFAAARQEDLEGTATLAEIEAAVSRTFAWVQLDDQHRQRWLAAAAEGFRRYQGTPAIARRRWARAGTSLSSARVVELIATEVIAELTATPAPTGVRPTIELLLRDDRLERLACLQEAPALRVHTSRAGARTEIAVDLRAVLADWLAGHELTQIANTHFSRVRQIDFRFEQLGDFLNAYFETFLPWVTGTLIAWVNDAFSGDEDDQLLDVDVPAYIRWGVNDPTALQLMNEGVRSRVLARAVSAAFSMEDGADDVRAWLGSLGVSAWQKKFAASAGDLRNLLDYARPPGAGILADLLDSRSVRIELSAEQAIDHDVVASMRVDGFSDIAPIEVFVGSTRVATIPSRAQADMHTVLAAGLPLEVRLVRSGEKVELEVIPLRDEASPAAEF